MKGSAVGAAGSGGLGLPPVASFHQRVHRFGREVRDQVEQAVFVGGLHRLNPVGRDAVGEQLFDGEAREGLAWCRGHGRRVRLRRARGRGRRVLGPFHHFHQLGSASAGVGFDAAALGPGIGVVVVADIAEQQAGLGAMQDDADVVAGAGSPEILVFGAVDAVQFQGRRGRVDLKIEGGGLGGALLLGGQAREAGGEGVGDAEFHHSTRRLVALATKTSSPVSALR